MVLVYKVYKACGAINNFHDGWGEREIKATKIQYGSEICLV
jgi:hypothetical protein